MVEISNILCPVDFSAFSRHALVHAIQLARWFTSPLTVLYVYPPPVQPPPVMFGGLPGPMPPAPFPALTISPERLQEEVAAELEKFVAAIDTTGVSIRIHARPGHAVPTILQEASRLSRPLLVLGTHGQSGFDRLVLGSVAEKILRKASCPVLTVPPPVSDPTAGTLAMLQRILCPVDFSDASLKGVEYALALAREADGQVLLMHVIEGLPDSPPWRQPEDPSILEYLRLSSEHALSRLRAIVPADARSWCHPQELLMTGKPYEEILRVAREQDVHLIVMGVHGRNPIDLMFFGSTTNHVIRSSTCPVLTMRG
jgi:nucleotide-binding universal stress UspA family protein